MKKLEFVINLEDDSVALASKKMTLSPPFYVSASKNINDNSTSVRIEYHPENDEHDSGYSRLEKRGDELFNDINEMFEGTPIKPLNGHEGFLPRSTLIFPNEIYRVQIVSEKIR